VKILQGLNYRVHKKVLNTREHGIPHNRPRLYIVAILQSGMRRKYVWPEPVFEPDLHRFLDVQNNGRKRDINNFSKLATDTIVHFRKKCNGKRLTFSRTGMSSISKLAKSTATWRAIVPLALLNPGAHLAVSL
jgi:site-specific DNA-cytosine methylase